MHVDLKDILGSTLLAKREGAFVQTSTAELDGKYVALYFSASWCPPCKSFTPKLRKAYLLLMESGKPFEIVFVSNDNSKGEFEAYYNEMPWLAVNYEEETMRLALARKFGIAGIPTLVVVGPDGKVLNTNARAAIVKDQEGARFPWDEEDEARFCCSLQ